MTIEEIDLYKLKADDIVKYLPEGDSSASGAKSWAEFAQMLIDKKVKAVSCAKIDKKMAEAIDAVLSIDIHLPESDPMQQGVPETLFEYNSPDESSPVLITSNSIITHQILKLIFDTAKVKVFVIPVDTNGFTMDNAAVAGAFTPMATMKAINASGIANKTSVKKAMISGLAGDQKSGIERIARWSLEIGPISGFELPMYILAKDQA
jgi:CO dehydrogenase/acetyl-CoA synthase gamma subunit (corrinoid Fe-S protein)